MKNTLVLFVATFMLVAASASVQLVPGPCDSGFTYKVQDGDVLYHMIGENWADLIGPSNPGLYNRITVREDGMTVAMLYPHRGDVLCIPRHLTKPIPIERERRLKESRSDVLK